jgi:LacI family transcriptional regulator
VLIPDLTNPLFPPIVRGLEDGWLPTGVALIGNTDSDDDREQMVSS